MIAADYIASYLERRGVNQVFELVGGMITFLLDSLHQKTDIQIISMHHEQAAAFAAEGAGRMTGVPGVSMATSGPGATNLLTAIGSCYFDSTPTVFITGQVNTYEQKGELPVRQLGFQETDIVSMARPITKAVWLINDVSELPERLEEAFQLATQGRPGPVLLDIPMDIQRADVKDLSRLTTDAEAIPEQPPCKASIAVWDQLLIDLSQSQRPLILAGGGIRSGAATELFRDVVHALEIPVVHSLMAVDVLPAADPLRVGMIGSYGNRWANIALNQCDFLLVLGSRLDVRQTGADTESFKGSRVIYHVDCEAGEMNNRVKNCHTHVSELRPFLAAARGRTLLSFQNQPWMKQIQDSKFSWPDTDELKGLQSINPNILMHVISAHSAQAAAYVVDVGQHQMWAAQSLQLEVGQRFLTSGGMGAMGFALPTAIGASLSVGAKPVVVVAGDGGVQLNIQELQTIRRLNLPVKIIVLNNHCHGMVRQFQESYFDERYQSTIWGYSAPSFHLVAAAYGIPSRQVASPDMLNSALDECWQNPDSPFLLEVTVDSDVNAYPKMAFGRPISEMEPLAEPTEMEST
jgi:acetolactate synthase-1/2/3 large subunit